MSTFVALFPSLELLLDLQGLILVFETWSSILGLILKLPSSICTPAPRFCGLSCMLEHDYAALRVSIALEMFSYYDPDGNSLCPPHLPRLTLNSVESAPSGIFFDFSATSGTDRAPRLTLQLVYSITLIRAAARSISLLIIAFGVTGCGVLSSARPGS